MCLVDEVVTLMDVVVEGRSMVWDNNDVLHRLCNDANECAPLSKNQVMGS